MAQLTQSTFDFLYKLKKNNNRDWFAENKAEYVKNHEKMIDFADDVLALLSQHDNIETLNGKKSLYRIYRDVRFSKNKAPYKTHWAGGFKRATQQLRGGYFFRIEEGNKSMVAGGFWAPNKEDLLRIREEIAMDDEEFRAIITEKNFVQTFGGLQGDQLKTAPKSFPKDHKAIDLLRYKQYVVWKNFSDKEVLQKDFAKQVDATFQSMRPFFDYMSDVLTTDINGSPLF
ncbi:MAG TPA: DUF2461 domain-containing protein [Crocinitomicaceae bacterium]|nr:DUF2461 domain-containing protein [Crocinitomicaceae bacterium]